MSGKGGKGFVKWAGGTVAVLAVSYAGLFVIAWMDESVFETFWLEEYLPEQAYAAYGGVMKPVAWVLEKVLW